MRRLSTIASKSRSSRNQVGGGSIAELAPALLLLLLLIFFPMIDLLALGLTYMSCYTLNNLQLQRAIVLPSEEALSDTGPVKKDIVDAWKSNGMGAFVKLQEASPGGTNPSTEVTYQAGVGDDRQVAVRTTCTCSPFLTIPFPTPVPGLNAPMTFTMASSRLLEDPSHAPD